MNLIYKLLGAWIIYCIKDNIEIWNKFGGSKISDVSKNITKKLEEK